MTVTKRMLKTRLAALSLLGVGAALSQPDEARAYDMDCKVILCIAGGFPPGCADAYRYMIKRITRFPKPLPPFGFCPMSDGTEYSAHKVSYRYLGTGPEAYDCPAGTKLYFHRNDTDRGGPGNATAICYTHTTRERIGWGRDTEWRTVYHGQSPAKRVDFELRITIEPGTAQEFRSPLFRINWRTGHRSQRPV